MTVEDAGYDPAQPWDGTSEFSDRWYSEEARISATFAADDPGQTSFTPNTTPSSDWYGGASQVWITNISDPGPLMTFDIGFGNAWPAIVGHAPAALDTIVASGSVLSLSVTALDEDGDPTTYEWYENGGLVQSGIAGAYSFSADTPGAVDLVMVVATDGALADSLEWTVRTAGSVGVAIGEPGIRGPMLAVSPTPFDRVVSVRWASPRAVLARVTVHDLNGRQVDVLFEGAMSAATMVRDWAGRDASGRDVSAGVYFVRLEAAGVTETRKVVLLR